MANDEPRARTMLKRLISAESRLHLIGEAADGRAALSDIETVQPEIVFLDISMPFLSGLELVRTLTYKPYVIFTTAYAEYAIPAFELQALDYLLKPFGSRRFQKTVHRVLEQLDTDWSSQFVGDRLEAATRTARPLERIFARVRNKMISISTSDILFIEASDDYVSIHTAETSQLVHVRMGFLSDRLPPDEFVRVHRSYIVRLDAVSAIESTSDGRVSLTLKNGRHIQASRSGTKRLRSAIEE